MFTGLVHSTGTVGGLRDGRLAVDTALGAELSAGDSVAVNGVCLTATSAGSSGFSADVVDETLRRSALGALEPGDPVNLELPLQAADRLGGHFVQGHVDGVGRISALRDEAVGRVMSIEADPELLRYVAVKGSIAVDGVSLTVSAVEPGGFSVSLIPETLRRTTLGRAAPGDRVNLEVDVLAKYVERMLEATAAP
jgi:riboflavin synthase